MNISHYIDHTILKPTTTLQDINRLCAEASQYGFAAVCVPPPFIKIAKQQLRETDVKIATVVGFPFGYSAVEAKIAEIVLAIVDGADELDIVINLIALKNNDWVYLANEITNILPVIQKEEKVSKLIIESGILTQEELARCCELYGVAGINYLKTSTGYAETGATLEAVQFMRKNLPSQMHIKASGGIRTYSFAKALIEAGAARLGCSNSVAITKEAAEVNA